MLRAKIYKYGELCIKEEKHHGFKSIFRENCKSRIRWRKSDFWGMFKVTEAAKSPVHENTISITIMDTMDIDILESEIKTIDLFTW